MQALKTVKRRIVQKAIEATSGRAEGEEGNDPEYAALVSNYYNMIMIMIVLLLILIWIWILILI